MKSKLDQISQEIEIGEKDELAGCNCLACTVGLACALCAGCIACVFPPAAAIALGASGSAVFAATLGSATAIAINAGKT